MREEGEGAVNAPLTLFLSSPTFLITPLIEGRFMRRREVERIDDRPA
jgi:hypothetical protein